MDVVPLIHDTMILKSKRPLGDFEMAKKLHQASGGNFDNLMKLLLRASAIAYDETRSHVDLPVLADALEKMRRGSKDPNPFGPPRARTRKPRLVEDASSDDEMSGLYKRSHAERETFAKA